MRDTFCFLGNRRAATQNYIENPTVIEIFSSVTFFVKVLHSFIVSDKGFITSLKMTEISYIYG